MDGLQRFVSRPCSTLLRLLYDADTAVSFKDGIGNVVNGADVFCSGGCHHVFRIDAHALHDLVLPFAVLQQNERSAIDHRAEAGKLTLDARYHPMHEADRESSSGAIGRRAVLAYRAEDDDPADQEDDYKLEKSQLSTGPPAKHAHHQEKEQVTEKGVECGGQLSSPQGTTNTFAWIGLAFSTPIVKW
jgi:hypothetical protein